MPLAKSPRQSTCILGLQAFPTLCQSAPLSLIHICYLETGYVTKVNGASGATYEGSELTEAGDTIAFTNTRDIGELTIEKTVKGAIGETDKPFEFELTLTPSGNGIGVDGAYDATLYTAGQESSTTVTVANGKATFTLTHDQRLVCLLYTSRCV